MVLPLYAHGSLLSCLLKRANGKGPLATTGAKTRAQQDHSICLGVAKGMDHLTGHHVVHRDLAARNVLLDVRMNVKVADFGLSRSFGDGGSDYYRSAGGPIPLRWSVNYS